ncbi:MAG: DUF6088 family protein [Oscillospiraceae bacterium]|nr:DUF6088 family protein [Oscillospiraceae bacterium]
MERGHLDKIRSRILSSEDGTVFVPSDFSDLADANSVKKSLSRLVKAGTIRRIQRGVYELPLYNEFMQENVAPAPYKVAEALARNYGWTAIPSGDTALNLLGLSTQVPAEWEYVSDGPYREYTFGKTTLRFKHTTNKDVSKLPYQSALLAQAMKALGRDGIDERARQHIARRFSPGEQADILQSGKYMTGWVYEEIKQIFAGGTQ